jgi:preprotein translocase subunit SecG
MQTVLMVAHLIIAVLLVGVILLQRTSEDSLGGLSGGSGFSGIMSVRSTATFFSRITVILGALFMINCLLLANLSLREANKSIVSEISTTKILNLEDQQSKPISSEKEERPIPLAQ